jgi:hypothetical protein
MGIRGELLVCQLVLYWFMHPHVIFNGMVMLQELLKGGAMFVSC